MDDQLGWEDEDPLTDLQDLAELVESLTQEIEPVVVWYFPTTPRLLDGTHRMNAYEAAVRYWKDQVDEIVPDDN